MWSDMKGRCFAFISGPRYETTSGLIQLVLEERRTKP